MKTKRILTILLSLFVLSINAQNNKYSINLNNIENDKLKVELDCPKISSNEIIYYFPKTVPGTYSELDYGRYISKFSAFDKHGNKLKVKRNDINSYLINDANLLTNIQYEVDDTWDKKVKKKYRIMEPGGTGFEKDKYFVLNNGGVFGCFEKMENMPIVINITKAKNLEGFSSLNQEKKKNKTTFTAKNYYELIDCPILFTTTKPETLKVGNCNITIASYSISDSASYYMKKAIKPAFVALEKFTGLLPVKKYNILVFTEDLREIGDLIGEDPSDMGLFKTLRVMLKINKIKGKMWGALEHGTSSFYYLPNTGDRKSYTLELSDVIIHEFMHIYTPLNLHSNLIGNFNYRDPKMSKHLWLYEGVTEYFKDQIQMQGGIVDIKDKLKKDIRHKIIESESYPDSIPFTKMSANVYKKPYIDLYLQVYQRGSVMAMLLDFEIMKLTNGDKTLKDIIFELTKIYGKDKSFDEEQFISEFVKLVHPDLQLFFDNYITGEKPLDIKGGFNVVGIDYDKKKEAMIPINITSKTDNDVKASYLTINRSKTIKKVGKNDIVGFVKGDKVNMDERFNCFKDENGKFVPEGTMITLTIIRNHKEKDLTFPAKYKKGFLYNNIEVNENMTPMQQKLFNIWTKGR